MLHIKNACIKQQYKKLFVYFFNATAILFLLSGCAHRLPQENKQPSYVLNNHQQTALYQFADSYIEKHQGLSGFYPLGDGQAALISRLALIENAQKHIDIQYYIYKDDETSQLLTWYLYRAAQRGVRVRLLLDDMQSHNDDLLARLSNHPNIEVRLFNPFNNRRFKFIGFLHDFNRLNHRMHNKALIADGAFAITGGRNIGNEYFSADVNVDFGDFDLMLVGTVLPEISQQFDQYWNHDASIPILNYIKQPELPTAEQLNQWKVSQYTYIKNPSYIADLNNHPLIDKLFSSNFPFYWSKARFSYDAPDKVQGIKDDLLIDDLIAAIEKAQNDFILVSPYFVPTKKWTKLFIDKAKRGIKITIITNSLASNDVFSVHGWYAKYRHDLLKNGVQIYETKAKLDQKIERHIIPSSKSSLHAKTFIVDANKVFVGSFNFDPRSMYTNTEMGVFLDSPEFVRLFNDSLNNLLNKTSYRLILDQNDNIVWHDALHNTYYHSEPDSGFWLKFGSWLSSILPVEDLL